jgi:hypothetical protein
MKVNNFLILLKEKFSECKNLILKTIRRIPKGARLFCSGQALHNYQRVSRFKFHAAWFNLLLFSYKVFNISEKSLKKSHIGYKRKCDQF